MVGRKGGEDEIRVYGGTGLGGSPDLDPCARDNRVVSLRVPPATISIYRFWVLRNPAFYDSLEVS